MKATVEQLQDAIARERAYQVGKWGDRQLTLAGWLLVAESELDEAIEAWVRGKWDKEAKAELLQFVTVGHRWLEMEEGEPVGNIQERFYVLRKQERPLEEAMGVSRHLLNSAWKSASLDDSAMAICRFRAAIGTGMAALLQHGIVERGEL